MAQRVAGIVTEVVAAPDFEPAALDILSGVGAEKLPPWRRNLRLLRVPSNPHPDPVEFRPVSGGLLMQTVDKLDAVVRGEDGAVTGGDLAGQWTLVAGEPADAATLADLQFAWKAIRAVKSNAILLAKDGASVGIGMGQVNRVDSCRLSVERAGADRAKGAVAASDAYFPFPDGLEVLLEAGVRAVVHPGGSIRDPQVIEAAQRAGVTMYHTGVRHFAH
jgi:phosphoribosylaminoimidazolecarboxamide formyltransferase/IMP cyclohydrolase